MREQCPARPRIKYGAGSELVEGYECKKRAARQ